MMVIVDYGLGNLGSILNMCKRVGVPAEISSDPAVIGGAAKLILPGVGSFDHGMRNLNELGLAAELRRKVLDEQTPILGICLGAQLMTRASEEGALPGLGWVDAETVRFRQPEGQAPLKVPHMGWSEVAVEKQTPLFNEMPHEPRFYFVHSYHFRCRREEDVLTSSIYGYRFTSSFARDNIVGVQFHPEKSHKFGMRLLLNFAAA